LETTLYRVVQEALTNIAKHAEATKVYLRLTGGSSAVELYVEDDGVGFDMAQVRRPGKTNHGIGLFGMREKVLFLGGKFDIRSQPGRGTRLYIEVPLQCSVAMSYAGRPRATARPDLSSQQKRERFPAALHEAQTLRNHA
jgi:signal transduction histidine kinase